MFLKSFFISLVFLVLISKTFGESPVYIFNAHSFTGWNPPDASLAVGINKIVSAVNGQIRLFDKQSRNIIESQTLLLFVNKSDAYDPRLIYDTHNERFVFSCVNGRVSRSSFIELAISRNSDPQNLSNDWKFFSIYTGDTNLWADFPMMGIDQYNIYITANMFSNNGIYSGNLSNPLWIIRKSVYTGDTLQFSKLELPGNVEKFSAHPAWNWDTGPQNFIINKSGNTILNIWVLTNTQTGNPQINLVSINARSQPFNNIGIPQLGTSLRVGAGDGRLNNVQIINGKLYTAHTLGNTDIGSNDIGKFIKWYQINLQNFEIEDEGILINDNIEFMYGGISADKNSNLGFTMVGGSPNQFLTQYYSYKLNTENSESETTRTRSIVGKVGLSSFGNTRYGDYSAVALDPFDKKRFWTLNEVPSTINQWNSYIVSFCPACDQNPEICSLDCGLGGQCITDRNLEERCECSTGFIGTFCEMCAENYYFNSEGLCESCGCLNGGICNSLGECLCTKEFTGNKCQFEREETECGCINGIKISEDECKCFAGYTGRNCNDCEINYFRVGNNCFDPKECEGTFSNGFCICSEDRTGAFCEKCLINNCEELCEPKCNKYQTCIENPQTDERKCECIENRRGNDCFWCYRGDCTGCPSIDTYDTSKGFCYQETVFCRIGAETDENGLLCGKCKDGYYGEYCTVCPECTDGTRCDDGAQGTGRCI